MKRNNELANKIRDKILQDSTIIPNKYVDNFVNRIFNMCPQELEQNLWEWVENKPYTNIKYIGVSINDLIELGYDKDNFLRLIDVLSQLDIEFDERDKMAVIKIIYDTSIY